jgi:hypothetical protein
VPTTCPSLLRIDRPPDRLRSRHKCTTKLHNTVTRSTRAQLGSLALQIARRRQRPREGEAGFFGGWDSGDSVGAHRGWVGSLRFIRTRAAGGDGIGCLAWTWRPGITWSPKVSWSRCTRPGSLYLYVLERSSSFLRHEAR